MFFAELVALVLAIILIRKDRIGRAFIFFIAFDFSILVTDMFLITKEQLNPNLQAYFVRISNSVIALIELLTYFYFFRQILLSFKIRRLITFLSLLFSLIIIIFTVTKLNSLTMSEKYVSDAIGSLEFIFLVIPCVVYFFQLLKTTSSINLFDRPTFWIVTGIFLYSLISIPYYLLSSYFLKNFRQFGYVLHAGLFFMPFTLNFLFLIRAFLCKKPLTI